MRWIQFKLSNEAINQVYSTEVAYSLEKKMFIYHRKDSQYPDK